MVQESLWPWMPKEEQPSLKCTRGFLPFCLVNSVPTSRRRHLWNKRDGGDECASREHMTTLLWVNDRSEPTQTTSACVRSSSLSVDREYMTMLLGVNNRNKL